VPHAAAFVEQLGPNFVTLRGQGGEEIAISAWDDKEKGVTRIRASRCSSTRRWTASSRPLPLASTGRGRMSTDVGARYPVRVMVTPAWETVSLQVDDTTQSRSSSAKRCGPR